MKKQIKSFVTENINLKKKEEKLKETYKGEFLKQREQLTGTLFICENTVQLSTGPVLQGLTKNSRCFVS